MDQHSENLAIPKDAPVSTVSAIDSTVPKRSFATRLFDYDIFLSFALGLPPRGTHSYASDLARRLRERDFTVFFSEDEAPPGATLDSTLRNALLASKTLVVIANRGTLQDPRWVRTEVDEFRKNCPKGPVVTINIGGALQDPRLSDGVKEWLDFQERIWLDETEEAVRDGIANARIVERLAVTITHRKANVKWRWVIRITLTFLAALLVLLAGATYVAITKASSARAEMERAVSLKLLSQASARLSGSNTGGDELAMLEVLAAYRINPGTEALGSLMRALVERPNLRKIIDTGNFVYAMAISPNGTVVATGGEGADQEVGLWELDSGRPVCRLRPAHAGPVKSLVFNNDGTRIVSSGYYKNDLWLWDAKTCQRIGPLLGEISSGASSIGFSHNGARIVVASGRGMIQPWDANSREPIVGPMKSPEADSLPKALAFSPDGSRIASIREDGWLQVWDFNKHHSLGRTAGGSVAFSRDGTRIVTGGNDGIVEVWDAKTGNRKKISTPSRAIYSVAFSPDGRRVVFGGVDQIVRQLNAETGKVIAEFKGHTGPVMQVAYSPDGTRIISGSTDRTLRMWEARTKDFLDVLANDLDGRVGSVAFSPDGMRVVSGNASGSLSLWDLHTRHRIGARMKQHDGWIEAVAFSPSGTRIASAGNDGKVWLWDAISRETIDLPLDVHNKVRSLAFSSDGAHLVAASDGYLVSMFDANTHERKGVWDVGIRSTVLSTRFSTDGRRIVFSSGWTVSLLDSGTDQMIHVTLQEDELEYDNQEVYRPAVALNHDATRIVAGSNDKKVRLWDVETGKFLVAPMSAHRKEVNSVAFSPDSQFIASGDGGGNLVLWDAKTGAQIGAPIKAHDDRVSSIAFSPDGCTILTGGWDNVLRTWPAPKIWSEELCKRLNRNMSHKEWREWVSPEIGYVEQCPGLPIPPDEPDNIKEKP